MRIKIVNHVPGHCVGQIVNQDDAEARQLIADGHAIEVPNPRPLATARLVEKLAGIILQDQAPPSVREVPPPAASSAPAVTVDELGGNLSAVGEEIMRREANPLECPGLTPGLTDEPAPPEPPPTPAPVEPTPPRPTGPIPRRKPRK